MFAALVYDAVRGQLVAQVTLPQAVPLKKPCQPDLTWLAGNLQRRGLL